MNTVVPDSMTGERIQRLTGAARIAVNRFYVGHNVRTVPPSAEADEGLRVSIKTVGVLQPILARPDPNSNKFIIVLGYRRWNAAIDVGLTEIPAEIREMTDAEVEAAQLAENIQRQDMHAVDQWRAVKTLIQDHGLTIEQAADALGLPGRVTRRMEMLGRLNKTLLAMCEIEMPQARQLRVIAAAPIKVQNQVAGRKGLIVSHNGTETVQWHDIVNQCAVRRISRSVAIFDTADVKGIAWDEDLFAQPGADDQFTTRDVDAFLKAQTKALEAKVAALVKARKRHQVALADGDYGIKLPAGFRRVFDFHGVVKGKPPRLKTHETMFHAVVPSGTVLEWIGADIKAEKAAKPATASAPADDDDVDGEAGDDDGLPEVEDAVKPPFTKAGLALIAAAKSQAVRDSLDDMPMLPKQVLALLVLALGAQNVSVRGNHDGFDDLAAQLLAPGGIPLELSDADVCQIGRTAIGRIVHFEDADRQGNYVCRYSGPAGEWIGAAIAAERQLPRFDTPEFLATASIAELKRAAAQASLPVGGTGAQLRERLTGRAPEYRPETAVFGAPAPKVRRRDDA
jgi:ParB/RepB/Spo0J family partition protein